MAILLVFCEIKWNGIKRDVYKKFRQQKPSGRKRSLKDVRPRDSIKRYKRSYDVFEKFRPVQAKLPRREDIFSFGQKNRDFSKIEQSRKKIIEKFNLKPEKIDYVGIVNFSFFSFILSNF